MNVMVVDANSMYARSWYAAEHMGAEPVEAISLMVRTMCLLLDPYTDKIGVIFDAIYLAWDAKQNALKDRDPKPKVYHETKEAAQDVLEFLFGATNYQHEAYEGDDIVATVVHQAAPEDTVYIVSADKDLQQLVSERVHYYCLNLKNEVTAEYITNRWKIKTPEQLALALAIVGDSVDNIKGVKGWGMAKCKKLFMRHVTEDMTFDEAKEALLRQMNDDRSGQFLESLSRTLLKNNVPGVERPARLRLAPPTAAQELGIPRIDDLYLEVFEVYWFKSRASGSSRRLRGYSTEAQQTPE